MKREDLEKIGLTKEQIDKVCDLNNADVSPLKEELQKAQDDLKVAQEKVKTTEEALKKFDGVDADGMKQQIVDLQADLKKKDEEHADELASRDFNDLTKESIRMFKGRNEKAIMALLDIETLKKSKNQKEDITSALKALSEAEDSKMLFGEPEAQNMGPTNPIGTIIGGGGGDSDAELRAAMGLPPVPDQK